MESLRFEIVVAGMSAPEVYVPLRASGGPPGEIMHMGTQCLVASDARGGRARCALFVSRHLFDAPGAIGIVGHYEALDVEAGAALLREATARLGRLGVVRVVGPMNGNTWEGYRLVVPPEPGDVPGNPPPFRGEPQNPKDYPQHFVAAGFEVVARYESRLDDLSREPDDVDALARRVAGAGFSLRPLDLSNFDAEISLLHGLSLMAFSANAYYSALELTTFMGMYEPLRAHVDPDLVLIALDRAEAPCGYLFAYPDPQLAGPPRLVVKTIAVLAAARGTGLASHMLDRLRWNARRRGFGSVVHALMHVSNASQRLSSRHGGRVLRRYALYGRTP